MRNAEAGCYSGPVVQTTGTVMSYCDTRLSVFHQRVIDEALRPAAEAAYPACMAVSGSGSPGGLGLDVGSALHVREGVSPGSVVLSWGVPCNDATVPNQDYAIYQGTLGSWSTLTSITCSTGNANSWVINTPGANRFWLVVPRTSSSEGSYGRSSSASAPRPRPPAGLRRSERANNKSPPLEKSLMVTFVRREAAERSPDAWDERLVSPKILSNRGRVPTAGAPTWPRPGSSRRSLLGESNLWQSQFRCSTRIFLLFQSHRNRCPGQRSGPEGLWSRTSGFRSRRYFSLVAKWFFASVLLALMVGVVVGAVWIAVMIGSGNR